MLLLVMIAKLHLVIGLPLVMIHRLKQVFFLAFSGRLSFAAVRCRSLPFDSGRVVVNRMVPNRGRHLPPLLRGKLRQQDGCDEQNGNETK